MRRRPAASLPVDQMEKGNGKNHQSRICFLAALSAFFWILLLYFHFVVLSGSNIDEPLKLEPSSQISQPSKVIRVPKSIPVYVNNPSVVDGLPKSIPVRVTNTSIVDSTILRTSNADDGGEAESFPFMRALRTVDNKSDPCGGRYVYVHDLPSRFNEDMLKECRSLSLWTNMCKFTSNAGLGPPLENVEGVFSNTGWYATNQFAVDVIFTNRM
ncbi:xyloglucan galactosyltransferase MUR3, partial [Carica papaya]|uniref:xyloglucan galactosyltransferase MUR3 n=1 Tax=Carica papaya TaxID=3649 RepID=UPI000B8CB681